ncbi:MAG: SDR family oxidoreductase [Candidatus Humimicrobiaceae bacterium]
MELNKKTAIITGSGRGIGKDIALALAEEGCNVVITSRTKDQLDMVSERLKELNADFLSLALDLSKKENIDILVGRTLKEFKSIDILINNASILYAGPFLELSEEEWDKTFDVNLKAVFLLSQKALKLMCENKSGYIINISSTAALEVPPGIAAYGISKLAVSGLSQVLYETGKECGVKVSTIYPGMTDTEMLRSFNPPVDSKKWMMPEDITGCVMFLLKQSERVVIKDMVPWAAKHDQI